MARISTLLKGLLFVLAQLFLRLFQRMQRLGSASGYPLLSGSASTTAGNPVIPWLIGQ
jgi:hypothetical protein